MSSSCCCAACCSSCCCCRPTPRKDNRRALQPARARARACVKRRRTTCCCCWRATARAATNVALRAARRSIAARGGRRRVAPRRRAPAAPGAILRAAQPVDLLVELRAAARHRRSHRAASPTPAHLLRRGFEAVEHAAHDHFVGHRRLGRRQLSPAVGGPATWCATHKHTHTNTHIHTHTHLFAQRRQLEIERGAPPVGVGDARLSRRGVTPRAPAGRRHAPARRQTPPSPPRE